MPVREEGFAATEPQNRAGRTDPPRKQDRGIAETAANIEHPVAGTDLQTVETPARYDG